MPLNIICLLFLFSVAICYILPQTILNVDLCLFHKILRNQDGHNELNYLSSVELYLINCNKQQDTSQVAYTFDAGPNAVLISHNRKAATLLLQRLLYYFPPQSETDLDRYLSSKILSEISKPFSCIYSISYLIIRAFQQLCYW